MDDAAALRQMGCSPEMIASATVNGRPLTEPATKKLTRVDGMNKTEALYAADLDWMQSVGLVKRYWFASVRLKLAYRTTYTPDFLVQYADRLEFVEVKGFLRDDAAIKYKLAREAYPWVGWRMIRREHGKWVDVNI